MEDVSAFSISRVSLQLYIGLADLKIIEIGFHSGSVTHSIATEINALNPEA